MPSFSPKPLAPQQAQVKLPPPKQAPKQDKKQEEEVPAWRTGLRKTTSSSTVPEPKKTETQADKLARSASTPRIPTSKPETKPPAVCPFFLFLRFTNNKQNKNPYFTLLLLFFLKVKVK